MADSNRLFLEMFSDRERIAHYADGPGRFPSPPHPGIDAAHRMTAILLAEHRRRRGNDGRAGDPQGSGRDREGAPENAAPWMRPHRQRRVFSTNSAVSACSFTSVTSLT